MEIVRKRTNKEPAPAESRKISTYALEHGLYTMAMGAFSATSLRIALPLNFSPEIIDLGLEILEQAITKTEQEM